MRYLLVPVCLVAAVGAAYVAWGPLHNLFEDYKDSPDYFYLILGLPFALLSASLFFAAFWLILHRRP
jgi:hypothetical protein